MFFGEAVNAFLLAFSALFSIINPVAGTLIFHEATLPFTHPERLHLARRVSLYSLIVMLLALWTGSYVLAFFGISLNALRIAGGIVVALFAWELLKSPEDWEKRKRDHAAAAEGNDIAFFPLTLPITTGPGTISVAVALGAARPETISKELLFFAGASAAAVAMGIVILVFYSSAERLARFLGPTGERSLSRLAAFLLLCIGVQIMITGITDILQPMMGH